MMIKGSTVAALSPSVAALVQGVMKSMLLTKLKPLAVLFLAAGLLGGTAYVVGSVTVPGNGPGEAPGEAEQILDKRGRVVAVVEQALGKMAEIAAQSKKRNAIRRQGFQCLAQGAGDEMKPEVQMRRSRHWRTLTVWPCRGGDHGDHSSNEEARCGAESAFWRSCELSRG